MGFRHATKERIDAAFDALDDDQSGIIEYAELEKKLRRLQERPRS